MKLPPKQPLAAQAELAALQQHWPSSPPPKAGLAGRETKDSVGSGPGETVFVV